MNDSLKLHKTNFLTGFKVLINELCRDLTSDSQKTN